MSDGASKIEDLAKFLRDHWSTITADPGTFLTFAGLIATLAYLGAKSHFKGTIEALREQITLLKEQLGHANELLAARPSALGPFARMTDRQFRQYALELIEEYRIWSRAVYKEEQVRSDERRKRFLRATDQTERAMHWHLQSEASHRESDEAAAQYESRFAGRIRNMRDELLKRIPAAPRDDGHQLDYRVNQLSVEHSIAKLEKLALQL